MYIQSTDSKNKEPGAQLETAGVGVKIGVNTLNKNVKIEELQSTRQLEGINLSAHLQNTHCCVMKLILKMLLL